MAKSFAQLNAHVGKAAVYMPSHHPFSDLQAMAKSFAQLNARVGTAAVYMPSHRSLLDSLALAKLPC